MGIRFYCPNGHKLNVKAFLAGKRGICPHCDSRFQIPYESEIPENAPNLRPAAPVEQQLANPVAQPVAQADPTPHSEPINEELALLPGAQQASPAPEPIEQLSLLSASEQANPTPQPEPINEELSRLPTAQDHPASTFGTPAHSDPGAELVPSTPAPGSSPTPAPNNEPDPIDEAPDSVWYVRPPSGGQYGPARGDVMRRWIEEGRVSADSLVWREGWADWKTAGPIFPTLQQETPEPASSSLGVPTPESSTSSKRPATRPPGKKSIATVVILGLVIVVLFSVLLIVLQSR